MTWKAEKDYKNWCNKRCWNMFLIGGDSEIWCVIILYYCDVYNVPFHLEFSSMFLILVCWSTLNVRTVNTVWTLQLNCFQLIFYFVAAFCLIGQEWLYKISMGGRLVIRLMILIIDAIVSTMDFSCYCSSFIYHCLVHYIVYSAKGKVKCRSPWNFPQYNALKNLELDP